MNDEAVCRTAPATPGLLNMQWLQFSSLKNTMFSYYTLLVDNVKVFYSKTLTHYILCCRTKDILQKFAESERVRVKVEKLGC